MCDDHICPARHGAGYHHPRAINELKGNIDLQGLLGLDDGVPAGYEQINIQMHVKADCCNVHVEAEIARPPRDFQA